MGRLPCCEKAHTNKGAWTKEEDQRLTNYIRSHGEGCWRSLPKAAGLFRCGKSCRLRWINYLRPDLKRGNFSDEEDEIIIKLHGLLGNKWSLIAGRLAGRTDNEIKNYWNTHIKRKLISRGIDPQTHRPLDGGATTTTTTTATICLLVDHSSPTSPLNDKTHMMMVSDHQTLNNNKLKETTIIIDDNNKCSSGTTQETLYFPSQQQQNNNKPLSLNLELSIGLPSNDDQHNHHTTNVHVLDTSNNSSSLSMDSQESQKLSCEFLKVATPSCQSTTTSSNMVAPPAVCSCGQLGFEGTHQLCNSCEASKNCCRYWLQ